MPTRVAENLGLPVFYPHMILEGGSIDVNGAGALLTSESCLLNPESQSEPRAHEIEQRLRDFLGVREILWLGDGIEGDDTDGHIDDLTRFVAERTVVTVLEENRDDTNYEPLQENLAATEQMRVSGAPLEIHDAADAGKDRSRRSSSSGELRKFLHREQMRPTADLCRSERCRSNRKFCESSSRRAASFRSIAAN